MALVCFFFGLILSQVAKLHESSSHALKSGALSLGANSDNSSLVVGATDGSLCLFDTNLSRLSNPLPVRSLFS